MFNFQYWQAECKEERIRRQHQAKKKFRKLNPVVTIHSENEDSSSCSTNQKGDMNVDDNDASTIAKCLVYAKDVSNIFSQSIIEEKSKWRKIAKSGKSKVDEEIVWRQAKRITKMIDIQRKNLDHLVELVADGVAEDCPNHNMEQLIGIAKGELYASNISSSICKGIA